MIQRAPIACASHECRLSPGISARSNPGSRSNLCTEAASRGSHPSARTPKGRVLYIGAQGCGTTIVISAPEKRARNLASSGVSINVSPSNKWWAIRIRRGVAGRRRSPATRRSRAHPMIATRGPNLELIAGLSRGSPSPRRLRKRPTPCARAWYPGCAAPTHARAPRGPDVRQGRNRRADVPAPQRGRRRFARHDQRRLAIDRDFRDCPGVRGDRAQGGEHGLQQRLRHALVRIGRKSRRVQTLQPGRNVVAVAGKDNAATQPEGVSLRFECAALGSVADNHQACVRTGQGSQRLDQVAVSLPAAQRGGDADDRRLGRQSEFHAPRAPLGGVGRRETIWIDARRHRRDLGGRQGVVAYQLFAQRLPRGDHMRGGARASQRVARLSGTAAEMWRVRTSGGAGQPRQASAASRV